jgi:hypothetical protein
LLHDFLGVAGDRVLSIAFMAFVLGFGLAAFYTSSWRRCLACRLALCPQHERLAKAGPWFLLLAILLMAAGTGL